MIEIYPSDHKEVSPISYVRPFVHTHTHSAIRRVIVMIFSGNFRWVVGMTLIAR